MSNDVNHTTPDADAQVLSQLLETMFSDGEGDPDDVSTVESPDTQETVEDTEETTIEVPDVEPEPTEEAALADAIARAIASSFDEPEVQVVIDSGEEEKSEPSPQAEPSAKKQPEETKTAPATEKKPVAKTSAAPVGAGKSTQKAASPTRKNAPQSAPASSKTVEQKPKAANPPANGGSAPGKAPVKNPGTDYTKIGRSSVKTSFADSFAGTFSGVIERQQEALPPMGVDLRAHERTLAATTTVDRLLSPVRYVIFILMMLCLAGRKYSWMTLGFMGGMKGTMVSLVLTCVALAVCWQSTYRAVRDIIYLRFSHESYLLLATILTAAEALMNRNASTLLPLLTMSWCVSGMGALMQSQGNLRALRAVITGRNKTGIRVGKKLWKDNDVIGKAPSGTAGFVRRQAEPDPWHTWHNVFFVPMLMIALVASAYISAKTESGYLTNFVTIVDIGMPVSMALCCARPYNLLSQALSGQGVVAGWYGIKSMTGKKAVMVYDSDLFPKGTITPKGIKPLGKMTMIQLVSYAASVVLRADIGLEAPFTKLVYQTGAPILDITYLAVQEGGVEARIFREQVQVGTYQYMQLMGISMPRKGSSNGVYIAVNGKLEGLFQMKYAMRSGSVGGFNRFAREKTLTSLIVTRNFTVNPAFIERSFKVPITKQLCPKVTVRRKLSQPGTLKGSTVCGYTLREGVSAYSRTVGGARRVHRMGTAFTLFSIVFSLYLMLDTVSALATGGAMIDPARVLLVHLLLFLVVEIGARLALRR